MRGLRFGEAKLRTLSQEKASQDPKSEPPESAASSSTVSGPTSPSHPLSSVKGEESVYSLPSTALFQAYSNLPSSFDFFFYNYIKSFQIEPFCVFTVALSLSSTMCLRITVGLRFTLHVPLFSGSKGRVRVRVASL